MNNFDCENNITWDFQILKNTLKLFISKKYIYIHICIRIFTHTILLQFAEKFKSTRPSFGFTSTVNAEESENEVIYTEIGKFLSPPAVRQVSSGSAKSLEGGHTYWPPWQRHYLKPLGIHTWHHLTAMQPKLQLVKWSEILIKKAAMATY